MFTEAFDRDLPKKKERCLCRIQINFIWQKNCGRQASMWHTLTQFLSKLSPCADPMPWVCKVFSTLKDECKYFLLRIWLASLLAIFLMNLICLRQKFNLVHQWRRTYEKTCSCPKNHIFLLLLPYLRLILFCFEKKKYLTRNKCKKETTYYFDKKSFPMLRRKVSEHLKQSQCLMTF